MTDLEALAKLASEATPGPWATVRYWPRHIAPAQDRKKSLGGSTDPVEDRKRFVHPILEVRLDEHFPGCEEFHEGRQHDPDQAEATAALIVAAVNALPALVRVALAARDVVRDWYSDGTEPIADTPLHDALRAALADLDA